MSRRRAGDEGPMRRRSKTPTPRGEAKAAGVRKWVTKEGSRVRDLEKRLAEALEREADALKREAEAQEQQTATSEILRIISSSPTYIQLVLDTVAESGARLCKASDASIFRLDEDGLRLVAHHGRIPYGPVGEFVVPVVRGMVNGRAVLEGRTIHVADLQAEGDEFPDGSPLARRFGHRASLSVPMMRQSVVIGIIHLRRAEAHLFTEHQIALLKTFADQAVIAIENVRLFTELQQKNDALTQAHAQVTDALEQQTATSEILRVISVSPTDVQPVFDAIADSAARLCDAEDVSILEKTGDLFRVVAFRGASQLRDFDGAPVSRGSVAGRAMLDGRLIHVYDIMTESNAEYPISKAFAQRVGHRTMLAMPLFREGTPIGVIFARRTEVRPFSDRQIDLVKMFADQAIIAMENVRLFTALQEKNQALTTAHAQVTETLEQQTATSEVLRVIASSATELQPVLETVIANAVRLAGANQGHIRQYDGELLRVVAHYGESQAELETFRAVPLRPDGASASGRAFLECRVIHIEDVHRDLSYGGPALAVGGRTVLVVPLLREGIPIGTISIWRYRVEPFGEKQIEVVSTFASQAVIAIENVRLFNETKEALQQQTAASDILRVISSSPTDVQPVFEAIVTSGVALFDGAAVAVVLPEDGEVRLAAIAEADPERAARWRERFPFPLTHEYMHGTAILDRRLLDVPDVRGSDVAEPGRQNFLASGYRAITIIPMLREDTAIGAISVVRPAPGPLSEKQLVLLKTFADQAVIAIENVRLFAALQEKNRDLTQAHAQVSEALKQQTATSEILRVISGSPTEVQPVFDTIVRSAVSLCDGLFSALNLFDGEMVQVPVAYYNYTPEARVAVERIYPMRPSRRQLTGRAILTRTVAHIPDVFSDLEYAPDIALAGGWQGGLAVPMLREGHPIGTILVARAQPGPFSDGQIAVLKTFADQAVIAIENVRPFKELEARTHDLTRSVGELRALAEVGQAISSTLDLQTVLGTVVARATQLSGTDAGVIYEYDEQREVFVPRATEYLEAEIVETMLATPVRKGEGATGRLAEVQEPIQLPDIRAAPAESRVRGALVRAGYRALIAVPLVREGHLLGGLTVIRKATGEFAPDVIDLMRTFATQSALAIQNARLFRELADKSHQLEVAGHHKSEFLANMSHELRTPLNAIIGFSEVLSERMFGELNEKQEEYLRDIHASGQHLLSLINDILDLSKIEAGRMELEVKDFDLPHAIGNAVTLVRERAVRRGITLRQAVDQRLGRIRGDERKAKQVLLNLLSNALKFTPEGGWVEVRATVADGMAEISVTDTGVGIAPEDQEAVFEEFRQAGTADKKVEGTGLGLALSRKFIELHGGRIWVQSEVGRGSTFTFILPLTLDHQRRRSG